MTDTKLFASALQTWFTNHPLSVRQIELESGVKNLAQFRKGSRPVTFDAIAKLLPIIERHSSRAAAVTLLIAYLTDETPPSHADRIHIQPRSTSGQPIADTYHELAERWEAKARLDSEFMAMWQGMDAYMHNPEIIITRHTSAAPESSIALLAEPIAQYNATPKFRPGHPQDTNRLDPMPTQHAAQENQEP